MSKFTSCKALQIIAILLFFNNQSLALNLVVSTEEFTNVDLSLESSTSTLILDPSGVLNGNITMGNSSQSTIFNGGILNGEIDGAGKVTIAKNVSLLGDIGTNSSISSLEINSGTTLSANNNNISIQTAAGSIASISIDSGGIINIGGGSILASLKGENDNVGTVNFNVNNTLLGNVGTNSGSLLLVNISDGIILNSSSKNINANLIQIGSGANLNYGNGTITGAVEGINYGQGTFTFTETKTTNFAIGQINALSSINVADSKTITLGGNISADDIFIGGKINSKGKNISANNIAITDGATLNIDYLSNVYGSINGDENGNGVVQFSGAGNITLPSALGLTRKIAEVDVLDGTSLTMNNDINADKIVIGDGSSGSLIQESGTLGSDENSEIRLAEGGILNYNGGTINGEIYGTSSDKGTFNVNHDYVSDFEIGKTYDLANLNIASEITLTANYNLSVNNILVSGNLDLGNSSKEIDGNISTSGGSATINLGSSSHTTSGDFSTLSGDILKINALNNSNIGNMEVGGNVSIASGLGLKISYDSNEGYLSDGTKIAIISGTSGFVSDLDDGDIDINNSSSNQSGLLTFKTQSVGSELFLIANRKGSETFSVNKSVAEIYQSIDKAGASASGELRDLQRLIDNSSTTNKNRESALKSLIPQNNQDLNQASLDSAKYSINITSNRVKNSLFGIKTTDYNFKNLTNNPRNFTGLSNPDILSKENISDLSKLNFDDEIFDNQAIWIQGFESSAAQQDVADADGYQYSNSGFAIGVDQEIARNLRFGISTSLSIGNVQSNSPNQKETDINSYQFNLYSGYNFESYFVTGILGVAINKYSSTRSIPDLNLIAKSSYGGQTYVGKFESGMIKEFKNGFVVSPRIGIIAARNQISTYKETGAGTLNLNISNKHNNFLEGRIGGDLSYENLKIKYIQIKPKFNLSYGYDFLGAEQSSVNSFEGQNSSFEIKNSNIDRASLKYGLGFDFYEEGGVLISFNYGVEQKKSYKAQTGSLYLRYDFW